MGRSTPFDGPGCAGETVRWGVIGPGAIAERFARAMADVGDGAIAAVASRSQQRAEAFAAQCAGQSGAGAPRAYDDVAALLADPDVDAVYVATPANRHEADTVAALEAGKPVLCEKPFAVNAAQARRMVEAARRHGLFLMDAVWSRFLPAYRLLSEAVGAGRIGEPRLVDAEFGIRVPADPAHRLFDPARGGGALLDLGVYPIQLCLMVLGPSVSVAAYGHVGETGVDEQVAVVLGHAGGGIGVAKAALRTRLGNTARIVGTEGTIELAAPHHAPTSLTVETRAGREVLDASFAGDGMRFEIAEVHRCLREGAAESDRMPLDETLHLMAVLDEVRAQIGLVLPGDQPSEQPSEQAPARA